MLASVTASVVLSAGSRITPPDNKYTVAQDVQLGQQAADEMRKQLPLLKDDAAQSYVETLGNRLVAAIPSELQHSEFHYTFEVVNVREINASALPGGPMFVNRGMIESAHAEGEIAGVMAHEISHVVLRHGTAQQSRAGKYQAGAILGQIAGAVLGGVAGEAVAGASQFGFGTALLRFSRDFEKQADLEGVQIMAAAATTRATSPACSRRLSRKAGAATRSRSATIRIPAIAWPTSSMRRRASPSRTRSATPRRSTRFGRTSSSCPQRHRPRKPSRPRHSPPTATPLELEGPLRHRRRAIGRIRRETCSGLRFRPIGVSSRTTRP